MQDALSFFVQSYKEIAAWCAVVERLAGFERALEHVRRQSSRGGIRRAEGRPGRLTVEGVDLYLPDGQPLMANINLSLGRGETVLLGGPSGSGKSTLVRAIAGIWPFGRGEIRVPPDARVLFLPQRPYLPIGALRDVVSYPVPPGGVDDRTLREALEAVGLPELAGRLDETNHWALQLSPGEQQRIAFARALVQKPDWLFLDEATSAVDEATEARLYRLVRERLPDTMVFSVGHRATLGPFHARRLMVTPSGSGPASIVEAPAADDAGPRHGALMDTTTARGTRPGLFTNGTRQPGRVLWPGGPARSRLPPPSPEFSGSPSGAQVEGAPLRRRGQGPRRRPAGFPRAVRE